MPSAISNDIRVPAFYIKIKLKMQAAHGSRKDRERKREKSDPL